MGQDYKKKVEKLEEPDKFLYQEFVRKNHAKRIRMWISGEGDNALGLTQEITEEIQELMIDDDVTNKKGIYIYVLTRNEKYLNIRAFTDNQKRSAYERQQGICKTCGKHFDIKEMEADHIIPWHAGGPTSAENCQMLCRECNRRKSGI